MPASDVVVVGGGIVGTSIALELQRRGHAVTIVEPDEVGAGTAAGSAGYLAWDDIFPIPNPGVIRDLPRMLLDKHGPLVIKPSYLPHMLGWGLRFLAAARPSAVVRAIAALSKLNRLAEESLFALAERTEAQRFLVRETVFHVSRKPETLEEAAAQIPILAANGFEAEVIGREALLAAEPALCNDIVGAVTIPKACRCANPGGYGTALARYFRKGSGMEARARAVSIESNGTGWNVLTDNGNVQAKQVVIAAGVWSGALLRTLGYRVPLESARGYHLMLPRPEITLSRIIRFDEPHFVATPMEDGLRLAGTVEFAGIQAPLNDYRADMLYDIARDYLPALKRDGAVRWMGHRPSLPDSLPVIGNLPRHPGIIGAFGHERRGFMQSAITARCVADLIERRPPPVDLAPFGIERF